MWTVIVTIYLTIVGLLTFYCVRSHNNGEYGEEDWRDLLLNIYHSFCWPIYVIWILALKKHYERWKFKREWRKRYGVEFPNKS